MKNGGWGVPVGRFDHWHQCGRDKMSDLSIKTQICWFGVKPSSDDGVHRLPGRVLFWFLACPFSFLRVLSQEVFGHGNTGSRDKLHRGLIVFWRLAETTPRHEFRFVRLAFLPFSRLKDNEISNPDVTKLDTCILLSYSIRKLICVGGHARSGLRSLPVAFVCWTYMCVSQQFVRCRRFRCPNW